MVILIMKEIIIVHFIIRDASETYGHLWKLYKDHADVIIALSIMEYGSEAGRHFWMFFKDHGDNYNGFFHHRRWFWCRQTFVMVSEHHFAEQLIKWLSLSVFDFTFFMRYYSSAHSMLVFSSWCHRPLGRDWHKCYGSYLQKQMNRKERVEMA